jgi:hypothetical protein
MDNPVQHWVHKTQDEDNPVTLATLGTQDTGRRKSSDTGNIGYTRHRTKTNKRKKHNTTQKTIMMTRQNKTTHKCTI